LNYDGDLILGKGVTQPDKAAFAEADRIVKLLDDYAGPSGVALVCSDHGATGWHGYVFGNTLLAQAGMLRLRTRGKLMRAAGASRLGSAARKVVPDRLTFRARRAVQSMFDPSRTVAYAARLGSQGFSVNLAGREQNGSVAPNAMEATLARLEASLRGAVMPSGRPLIEAIHRREDLYLGPEAGEAPDVIVETAASRWEVSDAIGDRRLLWDLSDLPLGCHHPDGIFALRAPGVEPATGVRADIVDVAPTLLYAAGAAVPEGLDGDARRDLFGPAAPAVEPMPAEGAVGDMPEDPYTPEEEALITTYLSNLGYL
jgi:predicted AlkP superfamily phosphohydrolase/phosphomutase